MKSAKKIKKGGFKSRRKRLQVQTNNVEKKNLFDEALPPVVIDPPTYLPKRKIQVQDITPDELLFAYEWADSPGDIKKALLKANIISPKDSKKTIDRIEYEYTHNPKVLQAYQEALLNKLESLQITNNKLDARLGIIAFTDRGLCKNPDGSTIPMHNLPFDIRQCIQEFEEKMFYPPKGHPYKKTRIKFYSAVEAIRMLRKNNDDDSDRAIGMTKAMASSGGIVNISNYNNCGNQVYNGDIFNDNTQGLDISKLDENELNILLKALNKQIPDSVQDLEAKIDEIIEDEIIEAQVQEVKEELAS